MSTVPQLGDDAIIQIWKDINNFGSSFWVFLILFIIIFFKQQWVSLVRMMVEYFEKKNTKIEYYKKDLIKHHVFKDLDYWLSIGIKSISLRNNYHNDDEDYIINKENMAREILRIKFETIQQSLKSFLEENDIDNMNSQVACQYFMDCIVKNGITEKQKFIERGISIKFLNKFNVISSITDKIILSAIKNYFNTAVELSASTKTYVAMNMIDAYMNIAFNNLTDTVESINGDLKDEMFDGKPMCKSFKQILRPPHPSYIMNVREKLDIIVRDLNGSRAFVVKYFDKDGENFHSVIYETTVNGVTSEIHNIQMISDDSEKNILNILKSQGCIIADIGKFGCSTIERFNARGVKGIIICPIYNNDKIDGALAIDYIHQEKFSSILSMPNIDEKLKKYSEELAPFIVYPKNYKF